MYGLNGHSRTLQRGVPANDKIEHERDYEEESVLPAFAQRHPEVLQMTGETARIERIERSYVLKKLIELCVDFQGCPVTLVERVRKPIQCENKTLRALTEQLIRSSVRGEFSVCGSQRDE